MVFRHLKPLAIAIFALSLLAAGHASAASSGGGLVVPGVAKISNVTCISGCNALRESSPGGTVQITGARLGSVSAVRFPARKGTVSAKPISATAIRLQVKVPKTAVTGRVRLENGVGSVSSPSAVVLTIGPVPDPAPSPLRLTDASTVPRVAYKYGTRLPTLNFVVAGGRSKNDLRIDIVSASGDVIASRIRKGVERGSAQRIAWSGKRGKRSAPNGRYRFVVRSSDGTAAVVPRRLTRTRRTVDPFGFALYGFMFPVRGSHSYGDGVGAGRGHQGQDVLANCGTPLVAARGGVVYYNDYQAGGAGHYLVIDTYGTGGKSQVYMHMPRSSRFKVGSRVRTGQRIGLVGTTGRSSACHLHFEEWSSPGWYQGGTFLSPSALLRRWDRYS